MSDAIIRPAERGRPYLSLPDAIERCLGRLDGLAAVDIGCGSGAATRDLAALGAEAVGIEPNDAALTAARGLGGGPRYASGTAAETGLADGAADLVFFSDSLHHAPDPAAGLAEARRVARAGGRLAVLEPQAPDPIWPVSRFIDDESAVYAKVQAALAAMVERGEARRRATLFFADRYAVTTPEAFVDAMTSVDPSRRLADADRAAFGAVFEAAIVRDDHGPHIPYWRRLDVFEVL